MQNQRMLAVGGPWDHLGQPPSLAAEGDKPGRVVLESRSQPVSRTRVQAFWVSVSALSTKLFLSLSDNFTGSRKLHPRPSPPPPTIHPELFIPNLFPLVQQFSFLVLNTTVKKPKS